MNHIVHYQGPDFSESFWPFESEPSPADIVKHAPAGCEYATIFKPTRRFKILTELKIEEEPQGRTTTNAKEQTWIDPP